MRKYMICTISALVLLGAVAGGTMAAIELRFDPVDQLVAPGEEGVLTVHIDEVVELRTIELRVEYDPDVLGSVSGEPGLLFEDTGCLLFTDFDDETPGEWFGASVVLGYDCWITGPGELYRWNFEGLANGYTRINSIEVILYDPEANVVEEVSLDWTYVFVTDGTDAPEPPVSGLDLEIYPNPFNPRTQLSISSESPGTARLDVYDAIGRRIGAVWEGWLDAGTHSMQWDARDEAGRPLPSGVYLFRLSTDSRKDVFERAVLLK